MDASRSPGGPSGTQGKGALFESGVLFCASGSLFRCVDGPGVLSKSLVARAGFDSRATVSKEHASVEWARAGAVCAHSHFCCDRLGHVSRSRVVLHNLWAVVRSRMGTLGAFIQCGSARMAIKARAYVACGGSTALS